MLENSKFGMKLFRNACIFSSFCGLPDLGRHTTIMSSLCRVFDYQQWHSCSWFPVRCLTRSSKPSDPPFSKPQCLCVLLCKNAWIIKRSYHMTYLSWCTHWIVGMSCRCFRWSFKAGSHYATSICIARICKTSSALRNSCRKCSACFRLTMLLEESIFELNNGLDLVLLKYNILRKINQSTNLYASQSLYPYVATL